MRRTNIMMGLALLLGLPACTRALGGADTSNYATSADDCGVSQPYPVELPVIDAKPQSPNSIILRPDQVPPGGVGVLKFDECDGVGAGGATVKVVRQSIRVVRIEPLTDATPAAASGPRAYHYVVLPPSAWPRSRR